MILVLPVLLVVALVFMLAGTAYGDITVSKSQPDDGLTAKLNAADLYDLATQAGFTPDEAVTAAAIAIAESNGNPRAYNPEKAAGAPDGLGSVGLWQIYQFKHPEFKSWDLYNPQQNANAAYSVFKGAGYQFRPWSTYTGKQYLAHLSQVTDAISA